MICKHGLDLEYCKFCSDFNRRFVESQEKNKEEARVFEKGSVNKQDNVEVKWYD